MTNDEMRAAISAVYTGEGWKDRVARMSDYQVVAVYLSFQQRNLIGKIIGSEPLVGIDRLTEVTDKELIVAFDKAAIARHNTKSQISLDTFLTKIEERRI